MGRSRIEVELCGVIGVYGRESGGIFECGFSGKCFFVKIGVIDSEWVWSFFFWLMFNDS